MRRPPSWLPSQMIRRPLASKPRPFARPVGSRNTVALSSGPSFMVRLRGTSSNSRKPSGLQAGPSLNFRSPTTFSKVAPGASSDGIVRERGCLSQQRSEQRDGAEHAGTIPGARAGSERGFQSRLQPAGGDGTGPERPAGGDVRLVGEIAPQHIQLRRGRQVDARARPRTPASRRSSAPAAGPAPRAGARPRTPAPRRRWHTSPPTCTPKWRSSAARVSAAWWRGT